MTPDPRAINGKPLAVSASATPGRDLDALVGVGHHRFKGGMRSVSVDISTPTSYWSCNASRTKSTANATSMPFSCGFAPG
jgi:hypothetical protein